MDHEKINREFEAAIKAKDYERLDKLAEEYAIEVEKQKAKNKHDNPYK